MKKLISLLLVCIMVMTLSVQTMAAPMEITVFLDNEKLEFDVSPTSLNGRTLVPMRRIFEALGAEVKWIPEENKVLATKGNTSIELVIGSNIMLKNDEAIILDVPAMAKDGRTLVPVRAISEALDAKVNWIGEEYKVDIKSIPIDFSNAEPEEIVRGFLDAIENMDLVKTLDFIENGEEIRANLPEGTYAEIMAIALAEMLTQGTGELTGAYDAIVETTTTLFDEILTAYASKTKCTIANVTETENGYKYTVSITMPDENSLNNLSVDIDTEAISTEISTQLILEGKITPLSTEGEIMALVLPEVMKRVLPALKDIVLKADCKTITEDVTVEYKNGKWKITSEELAEEIFDISSMLE